MYESFFGLTMLPFKITPDPQFIYWNKEHRRAASIIAFGIEQLVPITVVTGDVGTGKTTLLQQFLEETPADTTVGLISNYWSGMGGLYQWILNAFDIRAEGGEVELFRAFQDFVVDEYAAGRRCVLIVDEAQNMSDADLEQLRMLTNINSGKDSLMMLFLVGQHQLRDRLREPGNRQIAQRVGAAFHLGPMSREDTAKYIRHRISVAGGTDDIFDDGALGRIHDVSGGVPRMINVVCELALVTAFGDGVRTISTAYIDEFLLEAEANGMIAHLPLHPEPQDEPGVPLTPVEDPKPTGPIPLNRGSRARTGAQAIRLVSEVNDADETNAPRNPGMAPAAKTEETEAEPAEAAPEQAEIMESVMAAQIAHRAAEAEAEAEADKAVGETAEHTPDPELTPPIDTPGDSAPNPEPARRGVRGVLAGLADHALHGTLVVLAVGAVYALILRPGDVVPPVSTTTGSPTPTAVPADPEPEQDVVDTEAVPKPDTAAPDQAVDHVDPMPTQTPVSDVPVPLDNPSGAALLEQALSSGGADPGGAALSYARAALRGEAKAAYYLGQMFETGAGVPRDLALARAWYELAQDEVRSARRRLNDLPSPETEGALTPPIPLLGGPLASEGSEFVWTSGEGPDPARYLVETSATPDGHATRFPPQSLSALQSDDDDAARLWRVIAADPASAQYAVSDWQHMGANPGPAGPSPVKPHIILQIPVGQSSDTQTRLETAFPDATVTSQPPAGPAPSTPIVTYFYAADAGAAEAVAARLGDGATVRLEKRALSDPPPPWPGELHVQMPVL